jgi:hypothetical protein
MSTPNATLGSSDAPPADGPDRHDRAQWRVKTTLDKYEGADVDEYRARYGKAEGERRFFAEHAPTETVEGEHNILSYGGVSNLLECLIGNGTATPGQALTFFNNANAYIGVGDSTTAEAATQTDLQATTNKYRNAVDSTYPQHTDGTTSAANTMTFRSTFGTSVANFQWSEWGIFNAAAGGRMLNRRVQNNGTKASSASFTFTVQVTLA